MANYTTKDLKLTDAVAKIESGTLRLPDFQRSYVWTENHRKALVESMQKGYPVGGLLLLDLGLNAESPFGEKLFEKVKDTGNLQKAQALVLDGQQRLTTSLLSFSPNSDAKKWLFIDLRKLFEKTGGLPSVSVDFQDYLVSKEKPLHPQTPLFTKDLLALQFVALGRIELRKKLHEYQTNLMAETDEASYALFIGTALESYLENLFDYQFPCVSLPTSLDLEAVANVFTKLNTGGVALSAFDLCVSKLFPKGENLRTRWDMARSEDGVVLLDKDGTALLQTVALLAGVSVKKSGLVKTIEKSHVVAWWDKSVQAFNDASAQLARVGCTSSKTLPYDTLGPALVAAILESQKPNNPHEIASRQSKIERWIIQTAFTQRYTEGSDAKKQQDFPEAKKWFSGQDAPAFLEAVPWVENIHHFRNTGARYKGFLAILNKKAPRDFVQDSVRLGLDSPQAHAQAQLHHIFPKAWLKSQNPNITAQEIDRALNLTFLTAESNNHITDNPPSVYLNKLLDEWKAINPQLSDVQLKTKLKDILAEHLIDEDGLAALLTDDYEGFLKARSLCLKAHLSGLGISILEAAAQTDDEDISEDSPQD